MTCKNSSGRREWSSVLKSHTSALHPPPRFPHTCSLWPVVEGCKGTFGLCEVRGGGWGLLWTSSCAWSGRSQFGEMGEGGEVFRAGPCRGIASPCVDATHLRELKKKKKVLCCHPLFTLSSISLLVLVNPRHMDGKPLRFPPPPLHPHPSVFQHGVFLSCSPKLKTRASRGRSERVWMCALSRHLLFISQT